VKQKYFSFSPWEAAPFFHKTAFKEKDVLFEKKFHFCNNNIFKSEKYCFHQHFLYEKPSSFLINL